MKKLTAFFVMLTADACLKCFWRKSALRTFLLQHSITEQELATWNSDESKHTYLTRLFDRLLAMKDFRGHAVVLRMARSLCEMSQFPDLQKWEDSPQKIASAKEAILSLRAEVQKLDRDIAEEQATLERRRRAETERLTKVATRVSLESLGEALKVLTPSLGSQQGGYDFEKWLYELLLFEDLVCRPPYRDTNGRQIDGSLTLDGTTFLIETKFTRAPVESPDIDIFLGKVRRKADNTMGFFLSMSGYSSGAIQNASQDRTTVLLMDSMHIFNLVLSGSLTFSEVLRRISRHASQTGEAFLAAADF